MDFYKRATELENETIAHRRYLHENAEVGMDLPKAVKYVWDNLISLGIEPKMCGYGVTAIIGQGSPVILLRADMDALPMKEESGEEFSCTTGAMHACGHDFHTAMLLTAAKMLKGVESELKGTVKLMFQPAEELGTGCRNMIENGIMENPKVDVAFAFHMSVEQNTGTYLYNSGDVMMASIDSFRIEIEGKGGHGAYPHLCVDPIQIGVQIHTALQGLIARESNPEKAIVLTIGKFQAGTASNIIPGTAVMEGTLRTNNATERNKIVGRIKEVVETVAKLNGGSAKYVQLSAAPPFFSEKKFTDSLVSYIEELDFSNKKGMDNTFENGSEDFALVSELVPSCYMDICAKIDGNDYPLHNTKVAFDESSAKTGAAAYAHLAYRWLEENA